MKSIRVVAVGLVLSAALMVAFAQAFFTFWQTSVAFHSWAMALASLSPASVSSIGTGAVAFTVLLLACLGTGLMLSATVYVKLEQAFVDSDSFSQLVVAPAKHPTKHVSN